MVEETETILISKLYEKSKRKKKNNGGDLNNGYDLFI